MKKICAIILLSTTYFLISCSNDAKKQPKKELISSVNKLKPASEKKFKRSYLEKSGVKNLEKGSKSYQKNNFTLSPKTENKPQIQNLETTAESNLIDPKQSNKSLMTFDNLKKILSSSEIGETFTQKELTQNFEIPREAVKIVKSITKTAEDEIEVKWKSTWFLEKVSDAKFKDGLMKITFKANKLYTSGTAIGIKYDKKIYTDLVIIGSSAYIPTVKGYSWQIGK
ncbi:hypothetical protein [Flavobacterium chungbukense]|uniref:Lipoprotein n=1 Tax=Flavobacterium chungbukense TaxID=877464 RepID=A0ABP7Y7G9_9FLAO|nr:hypothetical protein [Flavobacterium chungbukense]MCC4922796.1 hypothetical protein [Flavobacterium chungbukense]